MNLRQPNASTATETFNRSRNVVPMSGLCVECLDGCKGGCEMWLASFRGREVIYPGPFGSITAGADKNYPLDYSHLNIQGYACGAKGLPKGVVPGPDTATFPSVNTETEYGWTKKVKMKVPIFTGALGSTEIARKNWEHFAIGTAISGITLVCGENVCGIDPQLVLDKDGKVKSSPEMDRRIETYRRYHEGYGEILVQMNVEDTRFGVAEYVLNKHGLDTIELKWGQGAKCIGGEIRVGDLARAQELKKRGYIVTPDPTLPDVVEAFKKGEIKEFERHSRLGFVDHAGFLKEVARLRKVGFKRITLKTGAYGHAGAGDGAALGRRGEDRPADDRRRAGRHRDEPVGDDERVGRPDALSAVAGQRVRGQAAEAQDPGAGPGDGRRLLGRDAHLQGAGDGRAELQGGLHGPRADDPRDGRQEHRRVDQGRDAAQDGQQVRLEGGRDLRLLRGAEGEVRQGRREAPPGRGGHLHRDARRSAPACSS